MASRSPSHRYAAALALMALVATPAPLRAADYHWKAPLLTGTWSNPNAWSALSAASLDNAGVPAAGANVILRFADPLARTVTYDYTGPALTLNQVQMFSPAGGAPGATVTLNMTANALTATTLVVGVSGTNGPVSGSATFDHSGGNVTIPDSTGFLALGYSQADAGTYRLSGNATLASHEAVFVGLEGTGEFVQSGGVLIILPNFGSALQIAALPGSSGTYTLAAGSILSSAPEIISSGGKATFIQTGGTNTLLNGQSLILGADDVGAGTYNLSGGALDAGTGDTAIGHAGVGIFNQSGGTFTGRDIRLGGTATPAAKGTLSLSAGLLAARDLYVGDEAGTTGVLSLTGGTLNARNLTVGTAASSGAVNLANAVLNLTGTLSLGASDALTLSSGTLTAARVFFANTAPAFHWNGGILSITQGTFRLPNQQVTTLTAPFAATFAGAGASNDGWIIDNRVSLAGTGLITVGSNSVYRFLSIADNDGPGTLALTHAAATLNVYGNVYVSGNVFGHSPNTGLLSIAAGSLSIAGLLRGYPAATVALAGGTLVTGLLEMHPTSPLLWSGGTLIVTDQTVDSGLFNGNVAIVPGQAGLFTGASQDDNVGLVLPGRPGDDTLTLIGGDITVGSPNATRHLAIAGTLGNATLAVAHPDSALTIFGNAYVGGFADVRTGNATFIVAAGVATLHHTLKLWNGSSAALSNGQLHLRSLDLSANPGGFNWTGGTLRLLGGALTGPASFTVPAAGTLAGTGTVSTNLTLHGALSLADAGTLTVAGTVAGPGTVSVAPAATLVAHALRTGTLTLAGAARLAPGTAGASKLNALFIAGASDQWTGRLDLGNTALIVQSASPADKAARIATLLNQIAAGRNNGTWTGPGITSSSLAANATSSSPSFTLVLADNASLGYTAFGGQPVDGNSLLLTVAAPGDATLDGKVNAFDLNLLAAHWQQPFGALWSSGDFSGDGKVDAFDLNILAAHWQFPSAGALETALNAQGLSAWAPVHMPEPASLFLLSPFLALLTRRRGG